MPYPILKRHPWKEHIDNAPKNRKLPVILTITRTIPVKPLGVISLKALSRNLGKSDRNRPPVLFNRLGIATLRFCVASS